MYIGDSCLIFYYAYFYFECLNIPRNLKIIYYVFSITYLGILCRLKSVLYSCNDTNFLLKYVLKTNFSLRIFKRLF